LTALACPPLLAVVRRLFRRINLWSERSGYERLHELICRRTRFWNRNFLAFVIFIIFSVFPVVAPRRVHPPGHSLDPACKIRTSSYRSGYKRVTLARRVTNKERTKCCHKLVRRGGFDAGRPRCSDRLVQIAIRGRNLMLTLNFLLNQPRAGQLAKVS